MDNLTRLINHAKTFFGIHIVGELDLKEEDFIRCLETKTLLEFSVYFPFTYTHTIKPDRDAIYSVADGVFELAGVPSQIIGVNKMITPNLYNGGYDTFTYRPNPSNLDSLVSEQFAMDAYSAGSVTPTGKFIAPNMFEIFPKNLTFTDIVIELKLVHPSTCHTVPLGAYNKLQDLFLADLAIDILASREFFSTLQTVHGNIEMNLDRIRSMAERRDELIEKFGENLLRSSAITNFFIG